MRSVAVIVNPSAGGGRAGRVLPVIEQALQRHEVEYAVERTRSLEHARELAVTAAEPVMSPRHSVATA